MLISRVHVDRVTCPWLITRFVDSEAEFIFAPKCKVLEIAAKIGAISFDTDGAELHHRDDRCTFDAIIEDYQLTDAAMLRMAKVINAADTDRLEQGEFHSFPKSVEGFQSAGQITKITGGDRVTREVAKYQVVIKVKKECLNL